MYGKLENHLIIIALLLSVNLYVPRGISIVLTTAMLL